MKRGLSINSNYSNLGSICIGSLFGYKNTVFDANRQGKWNRQINLESGNRDAREWSTKRYLPLEST